MSLPKTLEPQFELIEHLPNGKILDCFRVKERKDKRPRELLLRLLPASFNDNQAVIDEFHGFFLKLSNLTNRSHIPIVYSVAGAIGGPVYVLEQYVSGVSLQEYIDKHRNSETFIDDLTEVVVRVCEGLHFAHQKDIFHCCITPDDILIDPDNPRKVKLVGFGTQILIKTGHLNAISESFGKFTAPEISSRGTIDTGCDIYSLATALSDACPEISHWNEMLARSQSRDQLQRPSSAREFGRELRKLADTSNKQVAENESGALITGGLNPVLTIRTDPEWAEVWSHGKMLGISTDSGVMVAWKPGTILEIRKAGYSVETLDLSTPPENTEIIVKLNSALTLYTNPWGASVKVNGVEVGIARRGGLVVPWDGATIEIQKAGYKTEIVKFALPPKEQESCVELQPLTIAIAPKWDWRKMAPYVLAGFFLCFVPVLIYSGVRGFGVGDRLMDKDHQISRLTGEINNKDSEIDRFRKSLKNAEQEYSSLRKTADAKQQEIDKLQSVVREKQQLELDIAKLRAAHNPQSQGQQPGKPAQTLDELGKLRKAAEGGDAKAQVELGLKFDNGDGVSTDIAEAFYWYRKAANQEDAVGQWRLGVMYEAGRGGNRDYAEAARLYKRAAEQGNVKGQASLGWMYEQGRGVGKNLTEAMNWYEKAASQGERSAADRLRHLR
jgi:serine/threonine protein kinase